MVDEGGLEVVADSAHCERPGTAVEGEGRTREREGRTREHNSKNFTFGGKLTNLGATPLRGALPKGRTTYINLLSSVYEQGV